MYHIYWFTYVELYLHPRDKSSFIIVYDPFYNLVLQVAYFSGNCFIFLGFPIYWYIIVHSSLRKICICMVSVVMIYLCVSFLIFFSLAKHLSILQFLPQKPCSLLSWISSPLFWAFWEFLKSWVDVKFCQMLFLHQ